MKADIFPPNGSAPSFIRLRDYALVLWYLETGVRREEGLISLEQLDLDFARAQTVQKVRRQAETRPLFFHAIRPLLRMYLEQREKHLKTAGREDVSVAVGRPAAANHSRPTR